MHFTVLSLRLNKIESSSAKDALYQVWLRLVKMKNLKSSQTDGQTVRRTDGRRTTGDQKSSIELSAQVSQKRQENNYIILKIMTVKKYVFC